MIFETVRDGVHPPAQRVPHILGACLLLVTALYLGSRIPPWMLVALMLPNIIIHMIKRALATYLDLDSVPAGSYKRMGTFFNPVNQRLLSEFLRALSTRSLWLLPLLITTGSGTVAVLQHRPYAEEIGLTMTWGGFIGVMFLEVYVLITGARAAINFRRDRRV
jgi:hypothetical protein